VLKSSRLNVRNKMEINSFKDNLKYLNGVVNLKWMFWISFMQLIA